MTDKPKQLICSICFRPIPETASGWRGGNNAEPVNGGRCCNDCDNRVVIPARIQLMQNERVAR
jgi:hypothetical protein